MCASRIYRGRGRGPMVPGEYSIASVGVLLPILSLSFFPFFPFVIAGLDPAIHAEAKLAQRFPPSARAARTRVYFLLSPRAGGGVRWPRGRPRGARPDDKPRNRGEGACPGVCFPRKRGEGALHVAP